MGGDAIRATTRCVPDLIESAHAPTDPRKHRTFRKREVTDRPLVLSIRRPPSPVLSHVHHARNHGLDATLPKGTMITPVERTVG